MKVEIFSKDGCPYCIKAKNLLTTNGVQFTEYKVGENGIDKNFIQEKAGKPIHTVPQIFINETHIGGFSDLQNWFKT
jgi:glutaredoxin 1